MKTEILNLSKHSLIYGVAVIINRAISFLMLPVYTRYIAPADYGVLELLTMTIDVIAMIGGLGLAASVFKVYADFHDPAERKEVISSAIIMIVVISFIIAALGVLLSQQISQLVFGHRNYSAYFHVFFIIYFLQAVNVIPLVFLRAVQKSGLFISVVLIKLIIQVALNIYFLIRLNMGIMGILYSTVFADFVMGLFLSVYTFRRVGLAFSVSKSKRLVMLGYPLVFWLLGSFVLTYSDRYFLNAFSDLESVGIYALAYKFGFLLTNLGFVPFNQIWEPRRFEIARQHDAGPIFAKVFLWLNIILIFMSLAIAVCVKDGLRIMADPSYLGAYKIVPIILLAGILQAWTAFCNIGLFVKEKTRLYAFAGIIGAIASLILNSFLIPLHGVYGAGWATVGAFLVRFLCVYRPSQRYYEINYSWGKALTLMGVSVGLYFVHVLIDGSSLIISIGVSVGLVVLFGSIVYRLFLEDWERTFVKQMMVGRAAIAQMRG